jgi:WhiB family redox-sensing transcriptional regulator
MTDMIDWIKAANCKGKTKYFFEKVSERPQAAAKRITIAKSICASCAVVNECREYARQNGELGVWGGETADERFLAGYYVNDKMMHRRMRAKEYKAKRRAMRLNAIVSESERHAKR